MAELAITFAETDHVTGACRHIYATGPNGEMSVSFRRTSRVPLNERMFYTPDLGLFPLYKVDRFHGLPNSVRKVGGWFIAMRGKAARLSVCQLYANNSRPGSHVHRFQLQQRIQCHRCLGCIQGGALFC